MNVSPFVYRLIPDARHLALWVGWNLGLAWLPVALGFLLARGLRRDLSARRVRWLLWGPLLVLWLLFLPNAAYLLTEWRHYLDVVNADPNYIVIYRYGQYPPATTLSLLALTAGFFVYSALGLLALFLAVHPLSRLASERWGRARLLGAQGLVFVLCSVGTYLGLVNRFNSWDVLRRHGASAVFGTLASLAYRPMLAALLLVFALFLWLLYSAFDIWIEGVRARLHGQCRSVGRSL